MKSRMHWCAIAYLGMGSIKHLGYIEEFCHSHLRCLLRHFSMVGGQWWVVRWRLKEGVLSILLLLALHCLTRAPFFQEEIEGGQGLVISIYWLGQHLAQAVFWGVRCPVKEKRRIMIGVLQWLMWTGALYVYMGVIGAYKMSSVLNQEMDVVYSTTSIRFRLGDLVNFVSPSVYE